MVFYDPPENQAINYDGKCSNKKPGSILEDGLEKQAGHSKNQGGGGAE